MMSNEELFDGFSSYIEASPTAFHAVECVKQTLEAAGSIELKENEKWTLERGKSYFVIRNDSALIAFEIPKGDGETGGYRIAAVHSDSPCFRIKHSPEIRTDKYVKLNTEPYGGLIAYGWFDRPLSVAGRIIYSRDGQLCSKLVSIDKDLLVIPSLAIHMSRQVNDGIKIDMQKDMLPLLSCDEKVELMELVAQSAGVDVKEIVDADLCVCVREKVRTAGAKDEFILAPRIDDLMCVYGCLQGYLRAMDSNAASMNQNAASRNVLAIFDNEEVGSSTNQGADSDFLRSTLERISLALGENAETYRMLLAGSFMVSADNAHASHPNYPEKENPGESPVINGGVVIKHAANQKYCTDAMSSAFFTQVCQRAGVPVQHFYNRSGQPGGSTLGNISTSQVSVRGLDIGMAQLAMHAPVELAGAKDIEYLVRAMCEYFRG